MPACLAFHTGTVYPTKLVPHVRVAGTLPTEPSPWAFAWALVLFVCTLSTLTTFKGSVVFFKIQ